MFRPRPYCWHEGLRPKRVSAIALALIFGLGITAEIVRAADAGAASTSPIPNRPEKLEYPPLVYAPPAPDRFRVALKSGPVAYVIPDRELPLVNIAIYVRTGEYLEPVDKIGLAELTGYLLARGGTSTRTAEELEERLAFLAAQLNAGVADTQGSVSLNLLAKDLEEGLGILREVLTAPRFQEDKLALRKQQLVQFLKTRNDDSASIEGREAAFLAYGEKFWANHQATLRSVEAVSQQDLVTFHRRWFHPANFVVAVSGDFEREAMIARLENLFGEWPFEGEKPPAIPTDTSYAQPGAYIVDKDVNQGRVSMMLPGIKRDNPDYFAVLVMNDILGGGGFTSRLVNRVRSDEGLAYSAGSSFPGGVYYPSVFTAAFQTKSRTVPFAISIILEEIKRIRDEAVSGLELSTSKQGFIDRFPRTFASKAQTANIFAQDEFTGRYAKEPGFWGRYRERLQTVSSEEVLRVAQKYLNASELVILIVGQKEQILLGHPDHPVKLSDLAGGRIVDVPLRDPMTMEPLTK